MIKRWLAVVLLLCMMLNMTAGSLAQVQSAAHSAMHIATDGEADIATDGEADIATDGEADIATDGEATEEPCEHESEDLSDTRFENRRYEVIEGDMLQHKYVYDIRVYPVCETCGQDLPPALIRTEERLEEHSWDENGFCAQCGYQNTCLHDGDTYWGNHEYQNREYISTGDLVRHTVNYESHIDIHCSLCNLYLETRINPETIGEPHDWVDGACSACGQEYVCTHTNTWQQESYTAEHVSMGDDLYHNKVYQLYYNINCDDCGATGIAQEPIGEYIEQYQHEWDANGVCTLCGQQNACLHANTWQQESYTAEHTSTGDPMYHDCLYRFYYNTNCDDCGATGLAREQFDEYTEQYEHAWGADGLCMLCGQEYVCAHTNTWQQESYTAEHVSTGDGLYHNKVYQLYYNINCDDCGATGIAQEPIGEHIEQYQHEWDANGVCTLCGQQNACLHANTWQQESYTAEHTSTGDPMYHDCLYRFYYNTNCDDCGATGLAQEQFDEYTEKYQHEWDASGVCSLCEQVNTCGHETEELHHSSSENHRYVSTGDVLQHDYVYDVYAYPICTTCGMYLPRVFVGTYVSYQTGHNWNTDGVCTDCAQVNTCPHDGGTSVSNEILNWRYEDTGDVKYHYNVYDLYEMTFCDVCSMRISQVFVNTERSESEHNWNDQAVCWECGQVNACAHTGGEYSYEIWQNHRSENVNNLKQHEAVADVYDTFFCNDCRLRLREEFNRVERNLEDHWWCQDGEQYICGGCQMVNTCTHTGEVTTEKWWTNGRFEDVGSPDYHNYLTDAYQSVFCADCRLFLEDQELGVEVRQDPHYYFDGKCESCGAACAHSETYVNLVQDGYQWVNVNELSYHEYHYADYNETRCSVCGMVIGRELVQSYADRYTHEWNDEGVCSACGMVNTCEHADTYHSRGYGFDFYEHASEAGKHYRTCNVIDYTYCSTCAMTLEEKTEGVERTLESHNYTDGVCDCGYVQGACEHPNAQQTGGSQKYKTFEKISNTEHSYSFDVYWKYSCPDCGVEYEVYIERGTETDVHTFLRDDSHTECQLCGYVRGTVIVPECRMALPAMLKTIGEQAFANLTAVTHFIVPAGVESIADDAFPAGVTIVAPEGSYAQQWAQTHEFAFEVLSAE